MNLGKFARLDVSLVVQRWHPVGQTAYVMNGLRTYYRRLPPKALACIVNLIAYTRSSRNGEVN